MESAVDRLYGIVTESDAPEQSLVVLNRTEVDPIQRLLETTFHGQSVTVSEADIETAASDVVVLVRNGEVVASSPLDEVMDACLLVNSDLYRTGAGGIDRIPAPAVITELDETVFELRGFPASVKEKLLLIVVSRFIERLALDCGEGVLRATFQHLSRMNRERGTLEVYRRLAATPVSVHVYGVGDWELPADTDIEVHTGNHRGYRESWCVVFTPPEPDGRHAALVALERGDNEWLGTWTYDRQRVLRIEDVLVTEF